MRTLLAIAAAAAVILPLSLAAADQAQAKPGWKGGDDHGQHAGRGWGGGPPPWAPAHGWRRKHGGGRFSYARRRYSRDGYGYRRW